MHSSVAALWGIDCGGGQWRNPERGLKAGLADGPQDSAECDVICLAGGCCGSAADVDAHLELLSHCAEGLK